MRKTLLPLLLLLAAPAIGRAAELRGTLTMLQEDERLYVARNGNEKDLVLLQTTDARSNQLSMLQGTRVVLQGDYSRTAGRTFRLDESQPMVLQATLARSKADGPIDRIQMDTGYAGDELPVEFKTKAPSTTDRAIWIVGNFPYQDSFTVVADRWSNVKRGALTRPSPTRGPDAPFPKPADNGGFHH